MDEPFGHAPVLPQAVCDLLAVKPGETVVDATLGHAGHARLFVERIGAQGRLIGFDVDVGSLAVAKGKLRDAACPVHLVHANFSEIREALKGLGVDKVDVILADLGVSSAQLDDPSRGFSFRHDGPLDMRMNADLKVTAADLVNRLKERDLADLLYFNAQEMRSRKIAKRICNVRREGRITTTGRLAEVVAAAQGINPASRKEKIHPATRTFMALRMAVNEEIPSLEGLLDAAPDLLNPEGRIGIIAFHSVEDKPVKLDFRKRKAESVYEILTKKPVVAGEAERRVNPRSRSAKLRVARRLPAD